MTHAKTIQQYLADPSIKVQLAMCLPQHVNAERISRIALAEIRRNDALSQCQPASLLKAVVQASGLGLEIGNNLGHAYLVPYKNEATLIIGYKGLIDLARRSGKIISIAAYPVYENDCFDFEYGLNEKLRHIPVRHDRGELIAFYAYAKLADGGYQMDIMWKEEIDAIRDASANYKWAKNKASTVWGQHYVEMGRKTLIRRIAKYLPMSIELQKAAALDERYEAGIIEDDGFMLGSVEDQVLIDAPKAHHESKSKSEQLADVL